MIGIELEIDVSETVRRLAINDIKLVEDLAILTDTDFKELGFSIGVKNKVSAYLEG